MIFFNIEENFKDYLRCHIKIDKEYGISWIEQSHLIKNFNGKFGEKASAMQGHGTPGTSCFKILRRNDEDKIPIANQSNTGPELEYFYTS
jgi:hypothetical protein